MDIKPTDTEQNKREKVKVGDHPADEDIRITKMIKKTSHEIISADKDTNLTISAQKKRLRSSALKKKREEIRDVKSPVK